MVYFKITKTILYLLIKYKKNRLLGCSKDCDKQFISYADLNLLVDIINSEKATKKPSQYEKFNSSLNLPKEENSKTLPSQATQESQKTPKSKECPEKQKSDKKGFSIFTEAEISASEKLLLKEHLKIGDVTEKEQPLYITEHLCNSNLKDNKSTTAEHIIESKNTIDYSQHLISDKEIEEVQIYSISFINIYISYSYLDYSFYSIVVFFGFVFVL